MSGLPRYAYLGPEGTFTEAALRLMASPDTAESKRRQGMTPA